jgi:hypothetical protein
MAQAGRARIYGNGTRVRVTASHPPWQRVEVLPGAADPSDIGRAGWTLPKYLVRVADPPPPDQVALRAGRRADMLFRSARNLEKAGKLKGALDFYRQVVRDHPDLTQAKEAAARIKTLEAK